MQKLKIKEFKIAYSISLKTAKLKNYQYKPNNAQLIKIASVAFLKGYKNKY